MITNITLQNFKCFRELEINPKLITVFIGPNGTGKSSVLQALLLLKQSVGQNKLQHQGRLINVSHPSEIEPIFLPEPDTISIVFAGNVLRTDKEIDYQYGAEFSATGSMLDSFGMIKSAIEGNVLELRVNQGESNSPALIWYGETCISINRVHRIADLIESGINTWIMIDPTLRTKESDKEILLAPGIVLQQLSVVPAVRGLVRPRYQLGDHLINDISLALGLNGQEEQTASNLGYSRSSEESLSKLLTKVTGTGLRAETVPPQSVEVKSVVPSGSVNMVAEGFGSNALILLFHRLITAEKGATVLIEEPEIHLHPKAQAELAEVLADTAKDDNKQLIITTHSEYVAGRLLTLVAEKRLSPDELAIYAFDKDEKGECSATEIEVTERGQVKGGLTGFHDATRDEMRRYVDGLRNRA